ncbi:MAG: peptide deformylase [Lewinellaceae bacterium]|nr:peptide deformylase [Lewinellaceae bacterium]
MILPIYAYGQPVLKKTGKEIGPEYPELEALIANMWETMYNAHGVGLAAPQIGHSVRLFIVDTVQLSKEEKEGPGIKQVFINAEMLEEAGEPWPYEEGCLSIPDIRGDVERLPQVRLRFVNEKFEPHEKVFTGIEARVIQHEYDHIEGRLFTERLKPIKRRLIQRKLDNIKKGQVEVEYRMKFPQSR